MPEQLCFDLGEAMPALSPDEELVHRYVRETIGPRVPTYIHRVEGVERKGKSIIADVRVFDGVLERFEFSGGDEKFKGGRWLQCRWHAAPDAIPFGYDDRLKRWRRYPEMREPMDVADVAYARLAKAEGVKERRRRKAA